MRRRELLTSISGGPSSGTSNGYDWVDIGGVKWATRNVGASGISDVGLYFSWGETTGYKTASAKYTTKNNRTYTGFTWASYANNLYSGTSTTYNSNSLVKYTSKDNKHTLDLSDDAANVCMGDKWRIPTYAEMRALLTSTTHTYTTIDSVGAGCFIATNGNILYFRTTGIIAGGSIASQSSQLNYWLAINEKNSEEYSIILHASFNPFSPTYALLYRCDGIPVRGVYDESLSINYEYVDLGLPSGLLWCKQDVGARSENERGRFYCYGAGDVAVVPNGNYHPEFSIYMSNEDPLASSADTATQVMGSPWRMPTKEEWRELFNSTNKSIVTSTSGYTAVFTNKSDSSKYIKIQMPTTTVYYWTSNPYVGNGDGFAYAARLYRSGYVVNTYIDGQKYRGYDTYCVRGVRNP